MQDLSAACGYGQQVFDKLLVALGGPFKPVKQQRMANEVDFLGLVHDVSGVFDRGRVDFTPRPALVEKP